MQSIQLVYGYQQGQETIQDIAGTPQSVCVQGLQSATSYRIQAILFDEGVELAQSNVSSFVTLGASAISLTLHNCSREGYNYRVHYLFSSTYTLSSAVLSCNGQTFQGTISGNTITFIVTGLTAGEAYLYSVTATDVYGFQETVTGSISTTVINEVNLYYNSRTENSVTFDLVYLHDFTFRGGWIGVWNSTDDPSTDNPISSEIWFDGDTQVTVPNLTAETTYKFRAGMTVEDAFGNQTTVYSSVVTATTADHDYSNDYFTIKNEYNGSNVVRLKAPSSSLTISVEVSTDNGTTWTQKTSTDSGAILGTLVAGGKMLVRHRGEMQNNRFYTTRDYSVCGNITSLTEGTPTFNATMPTTNALSSILSGSTTLIKASGLYCGGYTEVKKRGFAGMFTNCTALISVPDLSMIKTVLESGMNGMFAGCTALKVGADLRGVSYCETDAFVSMYQNSTNIEVAYAPTVDFTNNIAAYWLDRVSSQGTLYANSSFASTIPTNSSSGCPTNWTLTIL